MVSSGMKPSTPSARRHEAVKETTRPTTSVTTDWNPVPTCGPSTPETSAVSAESREVRAPEVFCVSSKKPA